MGFHPGADPRHRRRDYGRSGSCDDDHGYRAGVRKRALARMVWNTGLDLTLGSIPLLGDLFDVAFKSHRKNVQILKDEFAWLDTTQVNEI